MPDNFLALDMAMKGYFSGTVYGPVLIKTDDGNWMQITQFFYHQNPELKGLYVGDYDVRIVQLNIAGERSIYAYGFLLDEDKAYVMNSPGNFMFHLKVKRLDEIGRVAINHSYIEILEGGQAIFLDVVSETNNVNVIEEESLRDKYMEGSLRFSPDEQWKLYVALGDVLFDGFSSSDDLRDLSDDETSDDSYAEFKWNAWKGIHYARSYNLDSVKIVPFESIESRFEKYRKVHYDALVASLGASWVVECDTIIDAQNKIEYNVDEKNHLIKQ
jgi:hypothetical protein